MNLKMKDMKFISTKDMSNDKAPEGMVLVKYLEPFFGGWSIDYCVAYFDNPSDYEDENDGDGWIHNNTGNSLNVIAYCELPETNDEEENPFFKLTQGDVKEKYGVYVPNKGNVGK